MILFPFQNSPGPVDLFQQHNKRNLVIQHHARKADHDIGPAPDGLAVAVWTPDAED